eukprot:Nk52_evm15s24 gene=Nk52_evmTU15s24
MAGTFQDSKRMNISKREYNSVNILTACHEVISPAQPFALRLSSNLLIGIIRVYKQQQKYLWIDMRNAWNVLKKREIGSTELGKCKQVKKANYDAITLKEVNLSGINLTTDFTDSFMHDGVDNFQLGEDYHDLRPMYLAQNEEPSSSITTPEKNEDLINLPATINDFGMRLLDSPVNKDENHLLNDFGMNENAFQEMGMGELPLNEEPIPFADFDEPLFGGDGFEAHQQPDLVPGSNETEFEVIEEGRGEKRKVPQIEFENTDGNLMLLEPITEPEAKPLRKRKKKKVVFSDKLIQIPGSQMRENLRVTTDILKDFEAIVGTTPKHTASLFAHIPFLPMNVPKRYEYLFRNNMNCVSHLEDVRVLPEEQGHFDNAPLFGGEDNTALGGMDEPEVMRGEEVPDMRNYEDEELEANSEFHLKSRAALPWATTSIASSTPSKDLTLSLEYERRSDQRRGTRKRRRASRMSSMGGNFNLSTINDMSVDKSMSEAQLAFGSTDTYQIDEVVLGDIRPSEGLSQFSMSKDTSDFLTYIAQEMGERDEICFSELVPIGTSNRFAACCGFSSLLELMTAGIVNCEQGMPFADIGISKGEYF